MSRPRSEGNLFEEEMKPADRKLAVSAGDDLRMRNSAGQSDRLVLNNV